MEELCRVRVASLEQTPLLEPYTRRWCQIPRGWTCPRGLPEQPSGCVTWCMNAFCIHGDKAGVLQLLLDRVTKEVRPEGQDGRFYDKCHRHRAIRAMEPRRKAVSTVRGLARKYLAVLKDHIPSFEVTIHSPMLAWTIRHAAWVLTRDTVRRETRMTPF